MHCSASAPRTETGRFAPGASGNPAGRPKGARNRATLWDEALREGEGVARTRQLLDDAAGGDKVALRFVVDRIEPKARERFVEILLGAGMEHHPRVVFDHVTRALFSGSISIGDALAIGRFLTLREKVPMSWLSSQLEEEAFERAGEASPLPPPPAGEGREGEASSELRPGDVGASRDVPPPAPPPP